MSDPAAKAIDLIRKRALPLAGLPSDFDPLVEIAGDKRFVLIGEASHGTHEFYSIRAEITQRLIREKGFAGVAVEADWPDAYHANAYACGRTQVRDADAALSGFEGFPVWMWRNTVVLSFIEWLRNYHREAERIAGFWGIDLYSLQRSRSAVIGYLDRVDPDAARRARYRYSCFDHFGEDTQEYGYSASFGLSETCEQEVLAQLIEIQRSAADYARRDGRVAEEEFFSAEQNARLVKNAERYYRSMFEPGVSSWNVRDQHMADTLDELAAFLDRRYGRAKLVVWAHNSHLGDARATEASQRGEWNVGQLMRERHPGDVVNIGFSTYRGTVTAADNWGEPSRTKRIRPGLAGSYEELFHRAEISRFVLMPDAGRDMVEQMGRPRLQRAIGVIYRPETERLSHYFHARLADQFNAIIHIDETSAVRPLGPRIPERSGEAPETFPAGV
jgi:erythromycin esterase-like protein